MNIMDACWEQEKKKKFYCVREITGLDTVMAAEWMNARIRRKGKNDALEFPLGLLPRTGLACWSEGKLKAAIFLYLERSSSIAVCGWCVANPGNSAGDSRKAVEMLLCSMPAYARSFGAKHLLSTFGSRSINRLAQKAGFQKGETAQNMFMNL